jgi:hypothetical protein
MHAAGIFIVLPPFFELIVMDPNNCEVPKILIGGIVSNTLAFIVKYFLLIKYILKQISYKGKSRDKFSDWHTVRTQTHQSICFYQSILGIRRNG